MKNFYKGDLNIDRKKSLGKKGEEWLIGNFEKFYCDVRKTELLELKYWKIKRGEERKHKAKVQKSAGEVTIIRSGKVKGFIGEEDIILKKGEYVYIPPGIVNNLVVKVVETEYAEGLTIKAPSDKSDSIKIPRIH